MQIADFALGAKWGALIAKGDKSWPAPCTLFSANKLAAASKPRPLA
jgi:hypothetical protein